MASNNKSDDWQDVPAHADDWTDVTPKSSVPMSEGQQKLAQVQQWVDQHKNDTLAQKLSGSLDRDNPAAGNPLFKAVGPGTALSSMLSGAGFLPAVGRVAANTAAGGASGLINEPAQGQTRAGNAAQGAATGGLLSGAAEALSALLNPVGDYVMQKAVGMKHYQPGAGQTLADEGLWGTKGTMRGQTAQGLKDRWQDISNATSELKGPIDSEPVAERVLGMTDQLSTPSGDVPELVQPKVDKLADMAADISSRGKVSPQDALAYRKIAGGQGYRGDDPLLSLLAKASQQEQAGYSQALKNQYAAEFPNQVNKLAEADNAYGALSSANRALQKPETIPKQLIGMFAGPTAGAAIGYGVGGQKGAAAGALAGSPLGLSTIGRSALAASSAAPSLAAILNEMAAQKQGEDAK